jgi:hypothetical protein
MKAKQKAHDTNQPTVNERELDTVLSRLIEQWVSLHRRRPRYLYHYTTAQGLLGMFQSNSIWATHSRFMNDWTEISYCTRLVHEVMESKLPREDARWLNKVRDLVNGLLNDYEKNAKVYIACFCKQGDLLSQWRGYGAVGGGYSLGFIGRHLGAEELLAIDKPILRKVIYDRRTQERIIIDWLKGLSMVEEARQKKFNQTKAIQRSNEFVGQFQMFLSECMNCFKDEAYREEQEWRVIQFGRFDRQDIIKASFRSGRACIVPYVNLDFSPAKGPYRGKLPVKLIHYGPTLEQEVTERSLHLLRTAYGYDENLLTIKRSGVPFTG